MQWRRFVCVIVIGLNLAGGASAGIIFNKKPKPSPQHAQELIGILKTDTSESKRAAAADELGHYDGKSYPEIVPVLIEALRDSATSVRLQVVESLGKIRPVSEEAGMALEQTLANDNSTRVRLQARTTLWQYHVAGYRTPKKNEGPSVTPPHDAKPPATVASPAITPTPATTQEPPLNEQQPVQVFPVPLNPAPQPASRYIPVPASAPIQPPKLQPPVAPPGDQGPTLNAPK